MVEFRILGPLEVVVDGQVLALGAGKQAALLARLLLDANRVVPVANLIDGLWGEAAPETATKMVQGYVSHLRKQLPDSTLMTRAPGYRVDLAESALDLDQFNALLAEGRRTKTAGSFEQAREHLIAALQLWRGPALAEFREPFAEAEAARLAELQLAALEERLECELALGRHRNVTEEIDSLAARHPQRERLRSYQMLALYRSGRQPEALAAYRAFRESLDHELGIEPSAQLKELE